jgi:uncharacterized RDD family membrane protein YckC
MRTVRLQDRRAATWGTMALREFVMKGVIGLVAAFTFVGLVAYFWLLWDKDRQELWDKAVGTIVVDDPEGALDPKTGMVAQ